MDINTPQAIFYTIGGLLVFLLSFYFKKNSKMTKKEAEKKADTYITYFLLSVITMTFICLTIFI
ncbi:MAG: hypothetical protein L3J75_05240 [Methylococcaceae bacterium]|nr:hypothetical protein [Methylococcaceae bacterium]